MKSDKKLPCYYPLFFVLFLVFVLISIHEAHAQTDSCVTSRCHSSMGKAAVVHNPVKEGMCTTCHQVVQEPTKKTKHPGNLTITLAQKGPDLCSLCHEPKNKKKVVHAPIMGGDCTSCHNPHQSPNKGMLKEPMPKLCFQCHPDGMTKQKVMHPPVASGDCSGCHDNHQSDFPGRLAQPGNALCFTCHPDKEEGLKDKKKTVHPPVRDSCVQCHSPHGSANPAMLSAPVPELCAMCHPAETDRGKKAVTRHSPVTEGKKCMNCHDPHVADRSKLLLKRETELCFGCHDKELDTKSGKIRNMKAFVEANKNGHGPMKKQSCAGCHDPHGSDYWRLLAKYYPPDFYTAYSDGKYALCFTCHGKAAFTEMVTTRATGFRDGEKNLHFLHVNKSIKGRSCRSCHEVHADTGLAHHVQDAVGFSYWSMPMNYTPSKNGGSCMPGCHGEKRYSR
jgi:predicted CXXCH cytochrome family protein